MIRPRLARKAQQLLRRIVSRRELPDLVNVTREGPVGRSTLLSAARDHTSIRAISIATDPYSGMYSVGL